MFVTVATFILVVIPLGYSMLRPFYISANMISAIEEFGNALWRMNGFIAIDALWNVVMMVILVYTLLYMLKLYLMIIGWIAN